MLLLRVLDTDNRADRESLTQMSLALVDFHLPWRWNCLSGMPEFSAKVAPPDLREWVLYLEMSGTMFLEHFLEYVPVGSVADGFVD